MKASRLIAVLALTPCHEPPRVVSASPPPWLDGAVTEQAHANAPDARQQGPVRKGMALGRDDRTDWRIPLEAGNCYWFSAAGDQNVQSLSLYLWDAGGRRIDAVRQRGPRAVLVHCAQLPG